jgi:hypothetical protein
MEIWWKSDARSERMGLDWGVAFNMNYSGISREW